jgi:UDP-glucuronate 4-epimerase
MARFMRARNDDPRESAGKAAMKVLVTGAAGFIGSAVVSELATRDVQIVALDGLLGGLYPADEKIQRWERLSAIPGVHRIMLDLRDGDLSELPNDITHVINEAAMPGLGPSWGDFDLYSSCNLGAVARLVERARAWNLEKFVQISTSSVYGRIAVGDESLPTLPVSPYGATKLAAEHLLLAHWRDSGFPATVLRYFSVYGPGQRPDMAYRKFIAKALSNTPIDLYGDGSQTRSNTFIDDCAQGTIAAIDKGRPGEVYNISGKTERSVKDALTIIESAVGTTLEVNSLPKARGDQDRTFGDSTKAQKELGFSHRVSLEEGLERQVKWQRDETLF